MVGEVANTAGRYTYIPEEGYGGSDRKEEDTPFTIPSYLTAADNHSIANNNQTFLESAAETISNIPKFIGASILSGANQIYNIAPTLGNYMGGDFEISKAADVISAIDDDLGVYYQEHQTSVDVAGFLLSSIVPGVGGIRVLNAGQKALEGVIATGKMGKNMKTALGLLAPNRQKHLDKAFKEMTTSDSLALLTNKNTVKAMAAGYGQSVLEMAAFETATAITLSESPVLENQDVGDIVTNIAIFGLAFGTVGGVYNITKSAFAVKKAVKRAAPENAFYTQIEVLSKKMPPSAHISFYKQQLEAIAKVPLVIEPARREWLKKELKVKVRTLENLIREETLKLTGGDKLLAGQAYAMGVGKGFEQVLPEYNQATSYSRLSVLSEAEKEVNKLRKSGKVSGTELEAAEQEFKMEFKTSHATVWGERAGNTQQPRPQHISLSDTLGKNEEILITSKKVIAGKRSYDFSTTGIYTGKPVRKAGTSGFTSTPATGTGFDVRAAGIHQAQARNMWALELEPFKKGKAITIGENDPALLAKMFREFSTDHSVVMLDGTKRSFSSAEEFLLWLKDNTGRLSNEMLYTKTGKLKVGGSKKGVKSQEDIASMLNVRNTYLSGVKRDNLADDLFALESYSKEYTDELVSKSLYTTDGEVIKVYKQPRTIKAIYDTSAVKDLTGNEVSGMAIITQLQRQETQRVDTMFASFMEEDTIRFSDISLIDLMGSDIYGAGSTLLGAASGQYGSLAMLTEWIGKTTTEVITKKQKAFRDLADPSLYKLGNNKETAIEWNVFNNTLRSTGDDYVLHESGLYAEPYVVAKYNAAVAAGKTPAPYVLKTPKKSPLQIPIQNKDTQEFVRMHVNTNGARRENIVQLRTAQGYGHELDAQKIYPVPPDLKEFPFFALVYDTTITGTGHSKNIYASSAEELAKQVNKLQGIDGIDVLYKGEAERYFKSVGQYDQTRALNENYLNSLFERKGLDAPALIMTDETKIVDSYLNWALKQESSLVREFVNAKYERQFEYLRIRGEAHTNMSTAKYNNLASVQHAEAAVKNPYMNYVKTAQGVKNYSDYPFWVSANRLLDSKFSEMYERLTDTMKNAKTPEQLAELNTTLRRYGYKGAAYDMEMDLLANHTAERGVLQNFVQKANGILATVVLRLDHFNAAVNAISANILYGSEMGFLLRAIERGDASIAGELAVLSKIKVPGTDKFILSPIKMQMEAWKAFGRDTPEMKFFKDMGFVTSISEQHRTLLDTMSITGKETTKEINKKLGKLVELGKKAVAGGEKWTGNILAEEFNRFNAAYTMKQVTDLAVKSGVIEESRALAYINSFVNKTQGNYLAAQRPMLFQGAVGQSIGLFQTYQFNLMQQLLKYVGEGTAKDTATLLGLQGTIFGMNGLPAFNAINTHIVGTASGNTEHKDFYTAVYGAAGKDAGDWLMYGLASNFLLHPDLKTNMYVRGDINPRHLTIVPTDPASIPMFQAFGKFAANIYKTAETMANGGDFTTAFLQGLEHNGLSRPLAGLAQTLKGLDNPYGESYSTSKKGNVIASNDLFSLVNMARMAGGKPLGESVAIEAAYRFKTYALKDTERRAKLGQSIKTTMIAGQNPTREQIEGFTEEYVKLGGQRTEFNQWAMGLYTTANTSQANELKKNLNSPFAKNMQTIMGGYELRDFVD